MFELDPDERVPDEIVRILDELFDDAERRLEAMRSSDSSETEHAVHQFRKRCKELRAVARLVRPALGPGFGRFNQLVRDASAELSASRDAHVMVGTVASLSSSTNRSEELAAIQDRHVAIAQRATADLQRDDGHHREASRLLAAARSEVGRWQLPEGLDPIVEGLMRTYRRGRRARRSAKREPTDEHMHEWRKAAKNLWFQVRLLEAADPPAMSAVANNLEKLGDMLGEDHDLAVLLERSEQPEVDSEIVVAVRERQHKLRKRARRLGKKIYHESPGEFADRISASWAAQTADLPTTT